MCIGIGMLQAGKDVDRTIIGVKGGGMGAETVATFEEAVKAGIVPAIVKPPPKPTTATTAASGTGGAHKRGKQSAKTAPTAVDTAAPMPDLAPSNRAKYLVSFGSADTNGDGIVDGSEAKVYFSRSQLPSSSLSTVWRLTARTNPSSLTKNEFIVAMHLIDTLRGGYKGELHVKEEWFE
jgi:epidermal growth factor receptor substrate 15